MCIFTFAGTCHDVLPEGYVCECPHEYRGPECQATTRTFDQSNSYIWLEPLSAYELSSFSLEFMSKPSAGSGLLVYQGALRQGIVKLKMLKLDLRNTKKVTVFE